MGRRAVYHGRVAEGRRLACRWWSSDRWPWTASKRRTERRDNVLGGLGRLLLLCRQLLHHRAAGRRGGRGLARRAHRACSRPADIDTAGLQVVPGGKTFRWRGRYLPEHERPRDARPATERVGPVRPACCRRRYRRCKFLFLANGSPEHANEGARPVPRRRAGRGRHDGPLDPHTSATDLLRLLRRIDGLVLNDSEAKLLTRRREPGPGRPGGAADGPALRGHQEGRARGHVLQPARDLRAARLSRRPTWSIRPGPATVLPAA